MNETKGERREQRKQARRRMRVTGKSCLLIYRIVQERAAQLKKKADDG